MYISLCTIHTYRYIFIHTYIGSHINTMLHMYVYYTYMCNIVWLDVYIHACIYGCMYYVGMYVSMLFICININVSRFMFVWILYF